MKALEFYTKTIEYHNKIGYIGDAATIWQNNMSDIANIIRFSNTHEDLIDKVDQHFLYGINFPPELSYDTGKWQNPNDNPSVREKLIDWLLARLEGPFPTFGESKFTHSRNRVVRNGLELSGNFLRTYSIWLRILKYIRGLPDCPELNHVLELGAGAGHQARTLLLQGVKKYTIMDLPETLIFSFAHLSLCFPDKKLLWVTCEEDLNKIDEHDIVFVPVVFANKFHGKTYDLFLNSSSLGETNNKTINYWMDFIQNKVDIKYLFTLNRFLNTLDDNRKQQRINENECSVHYDTNWTMLNWELEPIYCRCPYVDTLHSRYVEIIGKREVPNFDIVEKSNWYLQEAKDEDWYRLGDYFGRGVMTARDNVLVNDMTKTGTLFKLWESIRYKPSKENVSLMLRYLDRITVRYPFEEKFYYERLLNSL